MLVVPIATFVGRFYCLLLFELIGGDQRGRTKGHQAIVGNRRKASEKSVCESGAMHVLVSVVLSRAFPAFFLGVEGKGKTYQTLRSKHHNVHASTGRLCASVRVPGLRGSCNRTRSFLRNHHVNHIVVLNYINPQSLVT